MALRTRLLLYSKIAACYGIVLFVFFFPALKREWLLKKVQAAPALAVTDSVQPEKISGRPIRLSIPAVEISLAVIPGDYQQQSWVLTNDEAQFATRTVEPNTVAGNTLFYGHNTPAVFQKTAQLQLGDFLTVETDNHLLFYYRYVGSDLVLPTDTTIFAYQGAPQVTLLTCADLFNSKRRLMYFKFEKVSRLP